jgi:hypothetical protein
MPAGCYASAGLPAGAPIWPKSLAPLGKSFTQKQDHLQRCQIRDDNGDGEEFGPQA